MSEEKPTDSVEVTTDDAPVFQLTPPAPEPKKKKAPAAVAVIDEQFERCWKLYGCRGTKARAERYWAKYNQQERDAIEAAIPPYVASTPDKTFRKHFDGWINPEYKQWQNEVTPRGAAAGKFSTQTRNEKVERAIHEIENNPELQVSGFDRDMAILEKLGLL